MSESLDDQQVKDCLVQLECHFTWELIIEEEEMPDLESRVLEEIDFLDTKFNVGIHNLLAYVRHRRGQSDRALQSLKEAEDLIQREHADQSDKRSLVTWGNYAWVCYHMGRLADAKTYLHKVENVCKKLSSPFRFRVECPETDSEQGWALLKCGGQNYERAKACFEKALHVDPESPEFNTGYAIITFRQDVDENNTISLDPLRKAVKLNPEDAYIKVLLALKLQDMGQAAEGEKYIEEALQKTSSQNYVFRYAAKFYRKQGSVDKALQFLQKALQATPNSAYLHYQIGLCYRAKVLKLKKVTHVKPGEQRRESAGRLAQLAIDEFQKTVTGRPTFELAYVNLADMYADIGEYEKAEENFQKALSMKSADGHIQQEIHLRYGRFQQFHRKFEDKAITHYLVGLKIEAQTYARKGLQSALEKLAKKHVDCKVNLVESISLLGLVHKLKGETNEALLCYERALRLTESLNPMF